MKTLAAIIIAFTVAGCRADTGSFTMSQARTYTDYDKGCKSKKRWLECDGARTPSEANGGSGE